MNLFDLHCDTAYELYKKGDSLGHGNCHISLDRAARYPHYGQVMAIWSDKRLDDDAAYHQFQRIADNLLRRVDEERSRAMLCRTADDLHTAWEADKSALLSRLKTRGCWR